MDQSDYQQQIEQERVEQLKRQILSGMLTKDAYERLARVRSVNQSLAGGAELYLLQAYQAGQVKGTVDDNQLKELLRAISSGTARDFKIMRK
jgi:DNA-binding TFAR19-related protein (PDSD5 family)